MYVEQITVTVDMDNGESHRLIVEEPGPSGGNPRFVGQQIDAGMGVLVMRLRSVATLYGDQIPAPS